MSLFASAYVKRLDCYFPQFCSASGSESSKAQRLKQLQQMSVRVLQIFTHGFIVCASAHQLMKFDFEHHLMGTTFERTTFGKLIFLFERWLSCSCSADPHLLADRLSVLYLHKSNLAQLSYSCDFAARFDK